MAQGPTPFPKNLDTVLNKMDNWTVVTGGSQGIGATVCEKMKTQGLKVLMMDIKDPPHENFDLFVRADFCQPQAAAQALSEKISGKRVARLLHIAGMCVPGDLKGSTLENIQRELNVNTLSLVALAQVVLPSMEQGKWGRIVVTGSRAALGKAERTGYSAAKAALTGIVRTWALEFIANGITVNVVAPGPTQTQALSQHNESNGFLRGLQERVPVGFVAQPSDIANAVAFLASDEARFITGQVLNVCGGTSIGFVEKPAS